MFITTQGRLQVGPVGPVFAELTFASGPGDAVTIGWSVRELQSLQLLELGCSPPCTRQQTLERAPDLLTQFLCGVATLQDWDPFPE